MLKTNDQNQSQVQNNVIHITAKPSTAESHVKKVSRHGRHHQRSHEINNHLMKRHPSSIIHVNIRKLESNHLNNDQSVQSAENLLSFSSILSARYRRDNSNQPSLNQSSSEWTKNMKYPLNEKTISSSYPSQLQESQNTFNNNNVNSQLKENFSLTNSEEQINNSQEQSYKLSTIPKRITVKSAKVIPNQINSTDQIISISNDNKVTKNQRSNMLDFIKEHSSFSKKKQIGKTTYKYSKNCCWPPSRLCVFASILGILLIGGVIGAIAAGVLTQQKESTTTTTTVTTVTTTIATTATTTSITTATTTSVTTTTTSTVTTTSTTTTVTTTSTTSTATTTSTTTTATTTSTATTGTTTSTSTTATTTTTATTSTTTTTNMACGSTCVNTTISTLSRLAFYSFDNVTTDLMGNYSATGIASPTYVSGWVGSAISFSYFNAQMLSTSYMPLNSRSFTIDLWFYATNLSTSWDFTFGGQNESQTSNKCLFFNIRNRKLFLGFYADDTSGNTTVVINQWYHAAFVYDNTTQRQNIYLNGLLDGSSSAGPLLTTTGPFTIGGARIAGSTNATVYYSGYIDHFTVTFRSKSACEIYLIATLACYFTFDSITSLNDSGPNYLTAINIGGMSVIGRVNQALQFSSALSYIVIRGITALTSSNTFFTISMWINPTNVTGGATLIHASTQVDGQGACLAMWGLTSTGVITVNVIDSSNNTISATASSTVPLNTWTHIAQTFSSTTGNYLYIGGTLVASVSASAGRPIGPYTILGASPTNTSYCKAGSIAMGQFYGSIDEYRVFRRELTAIDICRLANP